MPAALPLVVCRAVQWQRRPARIPLLGEQHGVSDLVVHGLAASRRALRCLWCDYRPDHRTMALLGNSGYHMIAVTLHVRSPSPSPARCRLLRRTAVNGSPRQQWCLRMQPRYSRQRRGLVAVLVARGEPCATKHRRVAGLLLR